MQHAKIKRSIGKLNFLALAHLTGKLNLANEKLTFDEWVEIYRSFSALKVLALNKMVEKASTITDWLRIYCFAYYSECHPPFCESALRELALDKLKESSSDFTDWEEIFDSAFADKELKQLALKKMKEKANSLIEWFKIYRSSPDEDKEFALRKMREFSTFAGWRKVCRYYYGTELENMLTELSVLKELKETASAFNEWQIICFICECENNDMEKALKKFALEKMKEKASNFNQWLAVCHFSSSDIELRKLALEKMKETASLFTDWFKVYLYSVDYSFGAETTDLALKKLAEFFTD